MIIIDVANFFIRCIMFSKIYSTKGRFITMRKIWLYAGCLSLLICLQACSKKPIDEPIEDSSNQTTTQQPNTYNSYHLVDQQVHTYTQEGGTTNFYLGKTDDESKDLVILYKPAITIDIWELEKTALGDLLGYKATYQVRSQNDRVNIGDTRKDFMTVHWQIPQTLTINESYNLTIGGVSRVTFYNAKSSEVSTDDFSAPGVGFSLYALNKDTTPVIVEDHTLFIEGLSFGTQKDFVPRNDEFLLDRFLNGWYIPEPDSNGDGQEGIAGLIIPESVSTYQKLVLVMSIAPNGPGYLPEFYFFYIYEAN